MKERYKTMLEGEQVTKYFSDHPESVKALEETQISI